MQDDFTDLAKYGSLLPFKQFWRVSTLFAVARIGHPRGVALKVEVHRVRNGHIRYRGLVVHYSWIRPPAVDEGGHRRYGLGFKHSTIMAQRKNEHKATLMSPSAGGITCSPLHCMPS